MAKGFLWWTAISLITALAIISWAGYMLYGQINNYTKMNARYQALEVTGVINMLQASPMETTHAFVPPFCAEIGKVVKVSDLASVEVINTSVKIEPGSIGCDDGGKYFAREDKIRIKET